MMDSFLKFLFFIQFTEGNLSGSFLPFRAYSFQLTPSWKATAKPNNML